MADYIDRNAIINAISREMDMQDLYLPVHFLDVLNDVPAADVVEVVRCKDCKWFVDEGMLCGNNIFIHFDHFYCYYGERKEANDDRCTGLC